MKRQIAILVLCAAAAYFFAGCGTQRRAAAGSDSILGEKIVNRLNADSSAYAQQRADTVMHQTDSALLIAIKQTAALQDSVKMKNADTVKLHSIGSDNRQQDSTLQVQQALLKDTLTIALCGDIMMGTTYPTVQLPENGGRDLFQDTKAYTIAADIALGNLEGTLCDGGSTHKKMSKINYAFRTPTSYAPLLKEAGYDFMSMANNHARDFGDAGIVSTEQSLDRQEIAYAGIAGRKEYAIVERDGVKYGICAFGHNSYTIKHLELETVKRILDTLRPKCDILIVSFHGGAEGRDKNHLPQGREIFLGENRGALREFAHFCIDNGADLIYGHGPHVVRCMEIYKDRFIAYSLGNFCTPYSVSLVGISGYAPVVTVKINGKGEFISGKIHSFIQQRGIGPRADSTGSVAKEIKRLTEADIHTSPIKIDSEGNISH